MVWPDGSWLFSKLLDDDSARLLTTILLVLSALAFVAAGFGLFFRQEWWQPTAVGAASFSSLIFILFWDVRFQALDAKGAVGILINLVVLFAVLILKFQP